MIAINQEVLITVAPAGRKYYKELGYDVENKGRHPKILVKAEHIIKGSHLKINYKCDFCGEGFIREVREREMGYLISPYDSCIKCSPLKREITNLEKYGTKAPAQNKIVFAKMKSTTLEKYGVENVMELDYFKDKLAKTKIKNNTTSTRGHLKIINGVFASKEQIILGDLLGGEVNHYVCKKWIDIVLLNKKIAIEYDGSGHWMSVERGSKTMEEFIASENKLEVKLLENGWKLIRIINTKDKTIDYEFIEQALSNFIESDRYSLTINIS